MQNGVRQSAVPTGWRSIPRSLLPVACCLGGAGHGGRQSAVPTGWRSIPRSLLPVARCLLPRRSGARRTAECRPYG